MGNFDRLHFAWHFYVHCNFYSADAFWGFMRDELISMKKGAVIGVVSLLIGIGIGYWLAYLPVAQARLEGFEHGVQAILKEPITTNACLKVLFDIQEERIKK